MARTTRYGGSRRQTLPQFVAGKLGAGQSGTVAAA